MLKPFYPADPATASGRKVNIIIIPGLSTLPPTAWSNDSGQWINQLIDNSNARAQAWLYDYQGGSSSDTIIQRIADEGQRLLSCLDNFCSERVPDSPEEMESPKSGDSPKANESQSPTEQQNVHVPKKPRHAKRKPLFFICHSLGGIVLKQALSITKTHVFRHLEVVEVISGIVLLGTPHVPLTVKASPNILELIMRLQPTSSLRKTAFTTHDNSFLAKCCSDFHLLRIEVPIVIGYETAESRVHVGMFKTSQVIIVPKELALTDSKHQNAFAMDQNHENTCKIEISSPLFHAIEESLKRALDIAPELIYKRFYASTRDVNDMGMIRSLTTNNEKGQALMIPVLKQEEPTLCLSQSPMSSRDATYGGSTNAPRPVGSDKVVTNFEIVNKNPCLPCFSMKVHKRQKGFFGRESTLDLIDAVLLPENRHEDGSLEEQASTIHSYALCGMGGMGKTQIAVEYAYSRRNKFNAIFFVTADTKNILSEEFACIAVELGLEEESETKDLTVSCEIVKGWLSNPVKAYDAKDPNSPDNEASWLLIFDNADDSEVLDDFWPNTGLGSVLVMSRDSEAKEHSYLANDGIDLQPFSSEDAIMFLQTVTRRNKQPGQERYAAEMVERLGGMPYLITQMAGVMSRLRLSYSDFLKLYNASGIDDTISVGGGGSKVSTEAKIHSISSKVGLDGLQPSSLALLCLISVLDPDRIPENILASACTTSADGIEDFPKNLGQYYEVRAELLQTSLINQNPETGDIWVHRILQDVVREKIGQELLAKFFHFAVRAMSLIWPFTSLENRFSTKRYPACAALFPSVVRLRNVHETMLPQGNSRHQLSSAKLFGDTGWYRFERGFQEESKEWFEIVMRICDGFEDKTSTEAIYMIRDTHHNLGTAAGETNDTKSFLKHAGIWLEMLQERGSDADGNPIIDYELAMGFNETGVAHAMDRQYEVAITFFERAIRTYKALPHYQDTMLGWSASNIGLMYWVLGRLHEAEQALLEIIEIFRKANGYDDTLSFKHHRIGDICHRLTDDNLRLRNLAEAQVLINQAIKVFSERPQYVQELARSTYKASQVSAAIGNQKKADSELRDAFQLYQQLVPGDRRGIDEIKEADYDSLVVFYSR
ncbi:uncharacterized protein E0L32_008327 [Thyridium curvatum]|uniref:DUF7779 domain-containing protein n=1 Tax=Thyridium curvatum TaxID=1093900 RepID=A0A507B1B6_9PEZI|nr:uncharacterized protein E0L32_008327 [Thyridium curvatum]TPX10758.1 hypothetical protein E0L32_008327 [Thyridium curvatum]